MDSFLQNLYISTSASGFFIPIMLISSFIAGIIASISPCSIGILPLIIGYIGGYSKESSKKLFIQLLSFSIGLSTVLSIIGVICAITGKVFTVIAPPVILLIFSSIILILGLNLINVIDINFPSIVKKMPQNKNGSLFIMPFIIGIFFALAASPCSSPLLISIMAIATLSKSILFSILMLFAFALGQCIIIILAALLTSKIKNTGVISKYSSILMKLCGLLLILTSLYIYYAIFSNVIMH